MVGAEELDVLHAHDTRVLSMMLAIKEDAIQAWDRLGYSADPDEEERISLIKSILGARGAFDGEDSE
jgi:hypothetical protein